MLWSNPRRGSFAIITAVASVPIMIAVGLATDFTRASAVRGELQRGVDAAAIAGARILISHPVNTRQVQDDGKMYFFANYRDLYAGAALVGGGPAISVRAPNNDGVVVSASADVPMMFGRFVGLTKVRVSASSESERYARGMELVLALDTTNSMSGSRLTNLKAGAKDLLDIVFGVDKNERGMIVCSQVSQGPENRNNSGGAATSQDNCVMNHSLLVGIVPFVATVNVTPARGRTGAAMPNIVDPSLISGGSWARAGWKGCVKARPSPFEEASADATPTTSPFEPYSWAATTATVTWGGTTYAGPNPWTSTTTESWWSWPNGAANQQFQRANVGWLAGTTTGPNKGCGFPIMPLQPWKSVAKTHIDALQVGPTNGTTVSLGFTWSWRLLSPLWRPWWQGGTWYTYNNTSGSSAVRAQTSTPVGAPRDYGTAIDKVVVLFTDGQNEMGNGTPDSVQSCCANAYGAWSARPLGSDPQRTLNSKTVEVCQAMKDKGIKIYVILLYNNPPQSILDVFNEKGCASGKDFFFQTATSADLRTAFRQVASSLSNLRLIR